jgi:hypothetical protein
MNEGKFSKSQIDVLRNGYETINTINPSSPTYKKLTDMLDGLPSDKLKQLAGEKIKWVSMLASNRVNRRKTESVNEGIGSSEKLKVYNSLSKGDLVDISYDSSIRKGATNTFKVIKGKTVVGKRRVERITLSLDGKPKTVKYYLYQSNGNVQFAIGYIAAVITDMKSHSNESINENSSAEFKLAQKLNKLGSTEMEFYDELENVTQKIGHPKYMVWLANALKFKGIDIKKEPSIKNSQEAEEFLYNILNESITEASDENGVSKWSKETLNLLSKYKVFGKHPLTDLKIDNGFESEHGTIVTGVFQFEEKTINIHIQFQNEGNQHKDKWVSSIGISSKMRNGKTGYFSKEISGRNATPEKTVKTLSNIFDLKYKR